MPRFSFTERRRRTLAMKAALDRLENRSTVTPFASATMGFTLLSAANPIDSIHAIKGGVTP